MSNQEQMLSGIKCPYCGSVENCDHFLGHTRDKRQWEFYDEEIKKPLAAGEVRRTDKLIRDNDRFFKVFRGK